eukprot:CAMPEP_0113587488 /NCGR_PEP_ID=MMETSP0015_2-20120614/34933_1 /TAXON_ID=2838 /ORGANISM="Odontella" /LENGTH=386 /DNA_ID=CAMNT_0000493147 /DNA_START=39 /DNA_END=1196 /DNA_ORIENTATION=+ /assembly_acc=CAM_ASM_000160
MTSLGAAAAAAANKAGSVAVAAAPAMKTRITTMLGCEYPLLLPGMSWISKPELVAAVSNAGGAGILATGPLNERETRASIRRIRELLEPGRTFGVGATLLMPGARENASVALEERVPLINVSLGRADDIADAAHSYGGKILATVTNARHARSAIESGADALLATGHEAAAHGGDATSLVLVPALASRFPDVPLVAAGGFADGRGLSAALALGADGVAMGTRFATTIESTLARSVKEAVADPSVDGGSTEADTVYGRNFDGIPARVMNTPAAVRLNASPASFPVVAYRAFRAAGEMGMPLWKVLPGLLTQWDKMYIVAQFGAATKSLKAATIDGDLEKDGVQFVGQCQGLIGDIPSVDDLVQEIMMTAEKVSRENALAFGNAVQTIE